MCSLCTAIKEQKHFRATNAPHCSRRLLATNIKMPVYCAIFRLYVFLHFSSSQSVALCTPCRHRFPCLLQPPHRDVPLAHGVQHVGVAPRQRDGRDLLIGFSKFIILKLNFGVVWVEFTWLPLNLSICSSTPPPSLWIHLDSWVIRASLALIWNIQATHESIFKKCT